MLTSLGHVGAVTLIASSIALLIVPMSTLKLVLSAHRVAPAMIQRSMPSILLHIGLSACIWALCVIMYKLWTRPRPQVIHRLGQRGSVMTETLIVLPVFFLLCFGMAQLAVNNIGGILANVAVYQAARAAWVWQPEVGVTRVSTEVTAEEAKNRVRIAAALVMTPVAPGDFLKDTESNSAFKDTRDAMASSQDILGTILNIPDILSGFETGGNTRATRSNLSISRALDESSFMTRSVRKFTHAYQATSVEISEDSGRTKVDLTFKLQQVMPFANRIFGKFEVVDGREGLFSVYERTYSFRTQPFKPNAQTPDGVGNVPEQQPDGGKPDLEGGVDWEGSEDGGYDPNNPPSSG
ncbi:TadE/TadG family type IV pilus assembly protein [Bradymonas sediminis]|nr:TadE family protein [Bradymonas sediminis]